MAILHHLARTGGTLISRCLGSMNGVCLLSEINPLGVDRFNPLRQAADWHQLVTPDEVRELCPGDRDDFFAAMQLIRTRAFDQGLTLIVRDWAHIDWLGFPFGQPTMKSSWENSPVKQQELERDLCQSSWMSHRCATVRHPVDQYLSSKRVGSLADNWDEGGAWRGMRVFAEAIQGMPWFRYEDFLTSPETVLQSLCDAYDLSYDPTWRERWAQYQKITGATINPRQTVIAAKPRHSVDAGFWHSLRGNEDFLATLDLLGYPTPEPLRRQWYSFGGQPESMMHQSDQGIGSQWSDRLGKDWDDEVARWRNTHGQQPTDIEAGLRLAEALTWIGETDEAADQLLKLISCCDTGKPGVWPGALEVQVLQLACEALGKCDRKYESIPARRRLAQLAPEETSNLFQLSLLLTGVGEVDESLAYCRRLLELDCGHKGAAANYLLYLNYSDRYSAAEVSNEHFRLGMRFVQPADTVHARARDQGDRLRVGYLGSDFYTHPVGKILLPILRSHDRERFAIHIYHDGQKSDAMTDSVRSVVDTFTDVRAVPDDQLVRLLREAELDVLVDLGGYTNGGNRLQALARRVAPVQASFLGYPNTSAIPTMDFRLTDRFADPPGLTDHLYGERLVWLDHAHLAWHPYPNAERILNGLDERSAQNPPPAPTLGVFNNAAKISPAAIDAYAEIMRRVPNATMVLKYGDRYGVKMLQDRFRTAFASRGVLPHRLEFRTQAETLDQHLQTMASVDLALDAFPYQGTMTSLECLSVGTPVVSCCGDYYAHRATSAMLMRMGLHELVAEDAQEYVEIAVQLLQNREQLSLIRDEVRDRFYDGPLTDPVGLTRELEEKFMHWCSSAQGPGNVGS